MKRLLVVCVAALLPCFLVSAQEADNSGRSVGLSVIPRLDLSPEFSTEGTNFTLGNTSLYSLFEGNISESVSFSVCNQWLSLYAIDPEDASVLWADTRALYQNTLKRSTNWLNWANVTFSFSNFSLTLGKDSMSVGGFEFDEYDFDIHPIMASSLWNGFDSYQWGAKLGWEPIEGQEFTLQATTSPAIDGVFEAPLFSYALGWNGTVGPVSTKWSVASIDRPEDTPFVLVSLGNQAELGDWTLGLDVFNAVVGENWLQRGLTLMPTVSWSLSDKFTLLAKGAVERDWTHDAADWFAGAFLHWYPLGESLRIHLGGAYNSSWGCSSVSLGATYYLGL